MKALLILIPGLLLGGCAGSWFTAHSHGLVDGRLTPCPSPPRCLSSQAVDPAHAVEPFQVNAELSRAWAVAVRGLLDMPRTRLVDQAPGYVHAEVDSPWGVYIDDVELLLAAPARRIHVRSSGRIGYYDFNVNRDRIEALRQRLVEAGVVTPAGGG